MYAGQYRNNPILERKSFFKDSSKVQESKPNSIVSNKNPFRSPKNSYTSTIFSSVPLVPWLSAASTSKVKDKKWGKMKNIID